MERKERGILLLLKDRGKRAIEGLIKEERVGYF
jgi:hypothetical protein